MSLSPFGSGICQLEHIAYTRCATWGIYAMDETGRVMRSPICASGVTTPAHAVAETEMICRMALAGISVVRRLLATLVDIGETGDGAQCEDGWPAIRHIRSVFMQVSGIVDDSRCLGGDLLKAPECLDCLPMLGFWIREGRDRCHGITVPGISLSGDLTGAGAYCLRLRDELGVCVMSERSLCGGGVDDEAWLLMDARLAKAEQGFELYLQSVSRLLNGIPGGCGC